MIVYVSIGNSDDKLSQEAWSAFVEAVDQELPLERHGVWFTLPNSRWQGACWCVEVDGRSENRIKDALAEIAAEFDQEWIAWAPADTERIEAS